MSETSMNLRVLSFSGFLAEVRRRSVVLYWVGLGHFVLGAVLLMAMPFDQGVLLGIDRLVKPFKFAVSIGIYSWTFAWFVGYLRSARLGKVLSWTTSVCMVAEIIPITLQPLRGTVSHFNFEDPLGGAIYAVMGVFIGINTGAAIALLIGLLVGVKELPKEYLLGVRIGLVLFLLGSAVGVALITNNGHTVGAEDGGPGLPVVNFSTEAGDLRIAHALGLHALQAIPLFAYLLLVRTNLRGQGAMWIIVVVGITWGAVTVATYLQAMGGHPLLSVGQSATTLSPSS